MTRPERPIFLVGFMGSGKSACARALAALLGRESVDTDERIEALAGRSIASIIEQDGEPAFRALEQRTLEEIVGSGGAGPRRGPVVATGGGAFLAAAVRRLLNRCGTTVWLDLPLDEVRRRVRRGASRPLWPRNPLEQRILYERRRAVYALCAIRVAATPGDPETIARLISSRIS